MQTLETYFWRVPGEYHQTAGRLVQNAVWPEAAVVMRIGRRAAGLYRPIEMELLEGVLPLLGEYAYGDVGCGDANVGGIRRGETDCSGARRGAGEEDVVLFCGSGMTSAVNRIAADDGAARDGV